MPATGRDMQVGDITLLEPNIHAGVKFPRAVMNEYYANEPMDQLNRRLFTFAAYNAGPGRIAGLRRIAAQRGLDPKRLVQQRRAHGRREDRPRDGGPLSARLTEPHPRA